VDKEENQEEKHGTQGHCHRPGSFIGERVFITVCRQQAGAMVLEKIEREYHTREENGNEKEMVIVLSGGSHDIG